MDASRLELAEQFLREAVFRSRAAQAFTTAIKKSAAPAGGNCGLGERAAVVLDLSERGRELFETLWTAGSREPSERSKRVEPSERCKRVEPSEPSERVEIGEADESRLARIHGVMRDWIRDQDALDRKRNHFLKAFRGEHGFDRAQYTAQQLAQFEAGLARVNDEENRARTSAAESLLANG